MLGTWKQINFTITYIVNTFIVIKRVLLPSMN